MHSGGGALAATGLDTRALPSMRERKARIRREVKQRFGEGTIFVDVVPSPEQPDQPTIHAVLEDEIVVDALCDHNGSRYASTNQLVDSTRSDAKAIRPEVLIGYEALEKGQMPLKTIFRVSSPA